MPSITYWNRLEPRPRSEGLERSLSAEIRDPAWLLARQWQLGEFQGADAGSPAYVRMSARGATMDRWHVAGGPEHDLDAPPLPGEAAMFGEPFDPDDITLHLELVTTLRIVLREAGFDEAGISAAIDAVQSVFPLDRARLSADAEVIGFLDAIGPSAFDGVALYRAIIDDPAATAARFAAARAFGGAFRSVSVSFVAAVRATYGEIEHTDPEAWQSDRLRYSLTMTDQDHRLKLQTYPSDDGHIDWSSFDATGEIPDRTAERAIEHIAMPGHVRFRGMPNERFWDFEDARTDFGDVRGDVRDLARLALIDFMVVHSTSWFMIPFDVPVGTAWRIPRFVVRDVFGFTTDVDRADRTTSGSPPEWTMFSTSAAGERSAIADCLVIPAVAGRATDRGATIEEVRFLRDEVANLAWGVKLVLPNGLGDPQPVRERGRVAPPPLAPPPATPGEPVAPTLRYRLQTFVPPNWIPFVPIREPGSEQVHLEMGALLDPDDGTASPALPRSRVLTPTLGPGEVYRLREEEVPTTGARVRRIVARSRWTDGTTRVWIQRIRSAGAGQGTSGLRFDLIDEVAAPSSSEP